MQEIKGMLPDFLYNLTNGCSMAENKDPEYIYIINNKLSQSIISDINRNYYMWQYNYSEFLLTASTISW